MKGWLFRLLFPELNTCLLDAAEREERLKSEYAKKFASFQRSPLDESKWVAKFVDLDAEYKLALKDIAELKAENRRLKIRLYEIELP
jgi:hypothetical protein